MVLYIVIIAGNYYLFLSKAFKDTYKDYKIWQLFRRNFKGVVSPSKPRIRCVEEGLITTSNPCVICRDRYLVVDYKVDSGRMSSIIIDITNKFFFSFAEYWTIEPFHKSSHRLCLPKYDYLPV